MPERFVAWFPAGKREESATLLSLHDDRDGLVVRVQLGSQTIEICFRVVVAFRSVLEESCVEFWPRFHRDKPGPGSFWVVEDSEWLASFTEADLTHYRSAKHYLIVTDDERIDVIACRPPEAQVLDSR